MKITKTDFHNHPNVFTLFLYKNLHRPKLTTIIENCPIIAIRLGNPATWRSVLKNDIGLQVSDYHTDD